MKKPNDPYNCDVSVRAEYDEMAAKARRLTNNLPRLQRQIAAETAAAKRAMQCHEQRQERLHALTAHYRYLRDKEQMKCQAVVTIDPRKRIADLEEGVRMGLGGLCVRALKDGTREHLEKLLNL